MDLTTEEKIKEAARKIFTEKGYSGARTRDIAEEAGINLALLNYYFRSKEKLFKIIIYEQIDELFGLIIPIIKDRTTDIQSKIDLIIESYFNLLSNNPDLPLFVLSELKNEPENSKFKDKLSSILNDPTIVEILGQINPNISPYHLLMNLIGLIIFPFISKPIFETTGILNADNYKELIETQKKIVPQMLQALFKIEI